MNNYLRTTSTEHLFHAIESSACYPLHRTIIKVDRYRFTGDLFISNFEWSANSSLQKKSSLKNDVSLYNKISLPSKNPRKDDLEINVEGQFETNRTFDFIEKYRLLSSKMLFNITPFVGEIPLENMTLKIYEKVNQTSSNKITRNF
ncbi:MAG: hypothetical protein IPG55_13135 [Saprospiraceae bacterium]|nr:hypothetical protein [Candidatus Defluviibacterium haderslevense]